MEHYFQSAPVFDQRPAFLDRNSGFIGNVIVARTGAAKGHGADIDRKFLLQVVDQANSFPLGIKSRFGHPNMCANALGTYLGRFKNFAYRTDNIVADLFLDETAKKSPSGNLFDYVMDMAEKNPDMFGASLAFISDDFENLEAEIDGKINKVSFFRLKELKACDIVDDPAATDGLFSSFSFAAQGSKLLDQNPVLSEFIFHHPDKIIDFLHSYLNNNAMKFPENVKSRFLKFFSSPSGVNEQFPTPPPNFPRKENAPALALQAAILPDSLAANGPDSLAANLPGDIAADQPDSIAVDLPDSQAVNLPDSQAVNLPDSEALSQAEIDAHFAKHSNLSIVSKSLFDLVSSFIPSNSQTALSFRNNQIFLNDSDVPMLFSDIIETAISFASDLKSQLSEQLETLSLQKEFIISYKEQIGILQSKLLASPSLPINVTDPSVSIDAPDFMPADTTGKYILSNIPIDLRYKLKPNSSKQ